MSITENLTKRRMNEKAKAERVYGEKMFGQERDVSMQKTLNLV